MVQKQIEEDKVRLAIINLAVEFENVSIAKDDMRKAYDECSDILQEKRASIDTYLKQEYDKDYEMHNALFRKAIKIERKDLYGSDVENEGDNNVSMVSDLGEGTDVNVAS
ncbi:hypothetical protein Tco_0222610 [Tanacetum coccineum]